MNSEGAIVLAVIAACCVWALIHGWGAEENEGTTFCSDCGAVIEDCCEPPLCCQCDRALRASRDEFDRVVPPHAGLGR